MNLHWKANFNKSVVLTCWKHNTFRSHLEVSKLQRLPKWCFCMTINWQYAWKLAIIHVHYGTCMYTVCKSWGLMWAVHVNLNYDLPCRSTIHNFTLNRSESYIGPQHIHAQVLCMYMLRTDLKPSGQFYKRWPALKRAGPIWYTTFTPARINKTDY